MSRHTIRAAVEAVDSGLNQATMAILIELLEKADVADLAIVEEAGTVVAVDDAAVMLLAWPAGVMIPEIGTTDELEVKEDETYQRQNILISQQHNAIRQLTSLVRSLTRLVELYVGATEVIAPCEARLTTAGAGGEEDGPST